MKIIRGTKREITLMQWNEELKKAEQRLANSRECYRRFGETSDRQHVEEDEKRVAEIKQHIKEVVEYMDKNNIR